jgi:hypothetical protein
MSKEVFANDLLPGDLIHPSEILKDELGARSLSQIDFVKMTSLKKSEANSL